MLQIGQPALQLSSFRPHIMWLKTKSTITASFSLGLCNCFKPLLLLGLGSSSETIMAKTMINGGVRADSTETFKVYRIQCQG